MVGSAWMPCERPTVGVILCSKARRLSAASRASVSAIRMSAARTSCTLKQVSSTSEEVMPACTKRASGPTISDRCVRKAMTSCLTSASMASMRATSNLAALPLAQIFLAASFGMMPSSAMAVGRMRLDLEPDAEARLARPDRAHLGAGIARDHKSLVQASSSQTDRLYQTRKPQLQGGRVKKFAPEAASMRTSPRPDPFEQLGDVFRLGDFAERQLRRCNRHRSIW